MPWSTDAVLNRVSKPYPPIFPTIFDLMPLMSFQQSQDSNLQICALNGSVSIMLGSGRITFKSKEHDIIYTRSTPHSNMTEVKYDSKHPEDTINQKALWNQVLDDLGAEFTELNINCRVPVLDVPPPLEPFGLDKVLLVQNKTGNFTPSLKRRFNLIGIRNTYYIMRNELREHGLWKSQYSYKLRGLLKTVNLVGYDGKKLAGWQNYLTLPEGHRFPPEANKVNDALISDKWWQDRGTPIRMLGAINSTEIEAILYMLKRRKVVITA